MRRPFAVGLAALLLAAACGGGEPVDPGPGAASGLTVTAENLVLADNVTRLSASTVKDHLEGVGPDALVFDGSAPEVADLTAGDILVLDELAVRTVTRVDRDGDRILIETEDAAISDVITDGRLGWRYDLRFDALPDAAYQTAMAEAGLFPAGLASIGDLTGDELAQLAAVKGDELKFVGSVKGFELELKLVPKADKLEFEMSASRSNVKIQAGGFISNFVQETTMEFDGGEGTLFDSNVTGLRGEAEVTWHAFQVDDPSLDSDIVAFGLPLNLPIPFMAGPIPMTLNIKMHLRVVPELVGGSASSGGSWKVTYDSDHGFSTNGGDPTPKSQVRAFVADLGSTATATAGFGVVGFGFGVEWPRIELQLGHPILPELYSGDDAGTKTGLEKAAAMLRPYAFLTLNTYASGLWTPGTTLTGDIPPCQRSSVVVSAIAGFKLSVLGMVELSDSKLLWEKKVDRFKDNVPCTLTGE